MCGSYVCRICMLYMYAVYACVIELTDGIIFWCVCLMCVLYMHAVYVFRTCMPYMYTVYTVYAAIHVCHTCMWQYAMPVCGRLPYIYAMHTYAIHMYALRLTSTNTGVPRRYPARRGCHISMYLTSSICLISHEHSHVFSYYRMCSLVIECVLLGLFCRMCFHSPTNTGVPRRYPARRGCH